MKMITPVLSKVLTEESVLYVLTQYFTPKMLMLIGAMTLAIFLLVYFGFKK